MNTLPRELTEPWSQNCRRCHVRTIGAFGINGLTVIVDAEPVFGGDVELAELPVGLRARLVEAAGDVDRYVRHRCANVPTEPEPEPPATPGDRRMTFGKFKGRRLEDINTHYLNWAIDNADIRDPELRRAMQLVAAGRT